MAVGDIYQVTLKQSFLGQECDAVFHYEQKDVVVTVPASLNNAQALGTWFVENVLPPIHAIQQQNVTDISLQVRNIFDDEDANLDVLTGAGTGDSGAEESMPPFNAYDFALTGVGNAVHNGRKRIVGLSERMQISGVVTNVSGQFAKMDAAATAITSKWVSALGLSTLFEPVVVKRVKEIVGGKPKYRLPAVIGEKVVKVVAVTVWKTFLAHQVSRAFGRGV